MPITRPLMDRFMDKVEVPVDSAACWKWIGATRGNGYGTIKVDGKLIDAHRASYILFHGPIEPGKLVLHQCDNRNCINPQHLKLGTYKDNQMDAIARGRAKPFRATRSVPLTDDEIAGIRDEYSRGVSEIQLSRKYSVPPTSLKKLLAPCKAK